MALVFGGDMGWATDRGVKVAESTAIDPAGLLPERDRLLLVMVFELGLSYRAAAAVMDVGLGTIHRRIRKSQRLLKLPLAHRLADRTRPVPPADRELLIEHVFHGTAVRKLAKRRGVHHDALRRRIDLLRQRIDRAAVA